MDPYPIVFTLILLLINALLAAGKEAFINLNKATLNRKAEEGDKTAVRITALEEKPDIFLAGITTGKALCKLGSAALILSAYSPLLLRACTEANWIFPGLWAAFLPTIALAVVFLLLGEIYPTRAARQKEESVYRLWGIVTVLNAIFWPLAVTVNGATSLLLKATGLKLNPDDALSREEIQTLVEESGDSGFLEEDERNMIEGILDFGEKTAEDVMTPRTDVYLIDANRPLSEYVEEMLNEKYSRIPVYRNKIDNIIGILYLKDFLCEAYRVGFENVEIERCLHDVYFVPEHKRVDELYRDLQASKNHMAVLIDEYGGVSGIVTIEDLIEEVMGDIDDEYDEEENSIHPEDDGSYLADGSTPISELNEQIGLSLDEENEDYDTVGGLIIKLIGYIPSENEKIYVEYAGCAFCVEQIQDKRIGSVRIFKLPETEEARKGEKHGL